MTTPNASTLLTYANLQMAAESLLDRYENQASVAALLFGNNRSSRIPAALATQFSRDWQVVRHMPNTVTGFSGTLFKNTASNELVLSFRSTEFVGKLFARPVQ